MPARWARVCFQELPSPCFREGALGTRAHPFGVAAPHKTRGAVAVSLVCHTPDHQGCPVCATVGTVTCEPGLTRV